MRPLLQLRPREPRLWFGGGRSRVSFRGCLGLLHKLCSINSTVEQLYKKLEFVEYLFRCSHNSTIFPGAECVELKPFG